MGQLPNFDAQVVLSLHCPLCSFQSHWTDKIESHFVKIHLGKTAEFSLYQCSLCKKISSSKTFILEHIELQHKPMRDEQEVPSSPSSDSDAIMRKNRGEMSQRPGSTPGTRSSPAPNRVISIFTCHLRGGEGQEEGSKLRRCVFCDFATSGKKLLADHYEHHGIKNFDRSQPVPPTISPQDESLNPQMKMEILEKENARQMIFNQPEASSKFSVKEPSSSLTGMDRGFSQHLAHQAKLPNFPTPVTTQASETRSNQWLPPSDMLNPFMLPNPYWSLGALPRFDAMAVVRRFIESNKEAEAPPEYHPRASPSTASGFSASQLAASNFEHQNRLQTTRQQSTSSLDQLSSAFNWGPTLQAVPPMFNAEVGNGSRRASPPSIQPPSLLTSIAPPTGSKVNAGTDFFRSLCSVAMSQQAQQEAGIASAKRLSMERSNTSVSGNPVPPSSMASLPAMMAAAAALAISGFPPTHPVSNFPSMMDSELSPSTFQIPEGRINGAGHCEATGLNLSTSATLGENAEPSVTPMEDADDEEAYRNSVGIQRRRKMSRRREGDIGKNDDLDSRQQQQQGSHHNQQRQAAHSHYSTSDLGSLAAFPDQISSRSPPHDARKLDAPSNFRRGLKEASRLSPPNSPEQGILSQQASSLGQMMSQHPPSMISSSSGEQHQHSTEGFDSNSSSNAQGPNNQVPGIFNIRRAVGLSRTNLPFPARKILFNWLVEHLREPYPSEEEKLELARETGLSRTTVNNWFINARRRYVKPLMQGRLVLQSGVFKTVSNEASAATANRSPTSPPHPLSLPHSSTGTSTSANFHSSENSMNQFSSPFPTTSRLNLHGNGVFPSTSPSQHLNSNQSLSAMQAAAAAVFNISTGPFGDNSANDIKHPPQQRPLNHMPWQSLSSLDLGHPKRCRRTSDLSNSSSPADASSRFPQKPSNHEKTPMKGEVSCE